MPSSWNCKGSTCTGCVGKGRLEGWDAGGFIPVEPGLPLITSSAGLKASVVAAGRCSMAVEERWEVMEPLDTMWASGVTPVGTARVWELSRELAACPAPGEVGRQDGDVPLVVAVRCPGSEPRSRAGFVEQGGGTEPGLAGVGPGGPAGVGVGPGDAVLGLLCLDSSITNTCPRSGMTPVAVELIPVTVGPAGLGGLV